MNITVFAVATLLLSASVLAPKIADADTGMVLAHESPRLQRCEARLARTTRSLATARSRLSGYQQQLERASQTMRQLRPRANATSNCSGSGNLKSASKAVSKPSACGNGNSCAQVIPFNVPNPTSSLNVSWANGMLRIQYGMIAELVPDQPMSALEAEEAKVCKRGQMYCQVAFRQLVLQDLVR